MYQLASVDVLQVQMILGQIELKYFGIIALADFFRNHLVMYAATLHCQYSPVQPCIALRSLA